MNWAAITVTDWILIGGFIVILLGLGRLERTLEAIWTKLGDIQEKIAPDEDPPEERGPLPPRS